MHRTQIYLQNELYDQLKARLQSLGLSISELIRRAVIKDLQENTMDDARTFFGRLTLLESFADADPDVFVRDLRKRSRLLREHGDCQS